MRGLTEPQLSHGHLKINRGFVLGEKAQRPAAPTHLVKSSSPIMCRGMGEYLDGVTCGGAG